MLRTLLIIGAMLFTFLPAAQAAEAQPALGSPTLVYGTLDRTTAPPTLSLAEGMAYTPRGRTATGDQPSLERRIEQGNTTSHVGIVMMVSGAIATGVGVVLVVPGAILALFGDPNLFIAGLFVGGIGIGIAALGGLTTAVGSMMSTPPLRKLGVDVKWTGLVVAATGLTVAIAGGILVNPVQAPALGAVAVAGGFAVPVGLVWQTVDSTAGYQRYKKVGGKESRSTRITPLVGRDLQGVAIAGRF